MFYEPVMQDTLTLLSIGQSRCVFSPSQMVARFILPVIYLFFSFTPVRRSTRGRQEIFEGTTFSIRDRIRTKQNGDRCSFSRLKTKTEMWYFFKTIFVATGFTKWPIHCTKNPRYFDLKANWTNDFRDRKLRSNLFFVYIPLILRYYEQNKIWDSLNSNSCLIF